MKKTVDYLLARIIYPEALILGEWVGMANLSSKLNLTHGGVTQLKRRFCLFSHYDPHGRIDDYVVFYLESLHKLGADILFITTSENLIETEIQKILPFCIHLIQRKNITLDFGSWKIGWMRANAWFGLNSEYDQLILANDSVYGPFFPISKIFASMEAKNLDFWGMSSSQELEYHLQSFFLIFEKRALQSEGLLKFWNKFLFYRSKSRIIQEYEMGLTRLALQLGWKIGAFVEFDKTRHEGVNSTLFSWDQLIEHEQFPFLKTEVLKLNRIKSPRVPQWAEVLQSQSPYPVKLIQKHLERVLS